MGRHHEIGPGSYISQQERTAGLRIPAIDSAKPCSELRPFSLTLIALWNEILQRPAEHLLPCTAKVLRAPWVEYGAFGRVDELPHVDHLVAMCVDKRSLQP